MQEAKVSRTPPLSEAHLVIYLFFETAPASPFRAMRRSARHYIIARRDLDPFVDALQSGAPAAPAALSLAVVSGPCKDCAFTKSGTVLMVGRTKARDIHIKDSAVSERHAELRWQESRWTLTDVGSSNGTVLNGRRLAEGTYP